MSRMMRPLSLVMKCPLYLRSLSSSSSSSSNNRNKKPLEGIRVLEIGQYIAGPFTATLLGYFGAEVIKIESSDGDPIRKWRGLDEDGTSVWWRSIGRNKKSVEIDLRSKEGRSLAKRLAGKCDVLVENFKPGTLEKWGMGPSELSELNPSLVFARLSGYGQTGPYAKRPGFASVCEAFGGFRHVNGFPDRPSVRPNLSLGDSLAGLHAAFGVTLALLNRERQRNNGGEGKTSEICEVVDVAIYESMFNMLEGVVPEFDRLGVVRQPSGSTLTGIVPTNTYLCKDGKQIVIGANGDAIFKRLCVCMGREDLGNDPELNSNQGRVKHQARVDGAVGEWTQSMDSADVFHVLQKAKVPAGNIYAVDDMVADPHYNAREMFEEVEVLNKPLKIPAICPRLNKGRGSTTWPGPELGKHTREVLEGVLDLTPREVEKLVSDGVVGKCL